MDYFAWADERTRPPGGSGKSRETKPRAAPVDELSVAEEILVQEHHASTSVIAKMREQVYDLLRRR